MASQNTATKIWEAFLANKASTTPGLLSRIQRRYGVTIHTTGRFKKVCHMLLTKVYTVALRKRRNSTALWQGAGGELAFTRLGVVYTPLGKNNKEALFIRDEANLAGMLTQFDSAMGELLTP